MLKTNLSGLICYSLAEKIKEVFEVEVVPVEMGTHTEFESKEILTLQGAIQIQTAINFYESAILSLKSNLDEIQEHAELITSKINQI
jgi:hypothetical protein